MLGTREVQQTMVGQAMARQAMAVATYSPASRSRPLLVKRYLLSRRRGLERSKTRQALEREKGDLPAAQGARWQLGLSSGVRMDMDIAVQSGRARRVVWSVCVHAQRAVLSCLSVQAETGAGRRERERAVGKLELAGRENEGPTHRPTRERRPGRKGKREAGRAGWN